MQETTVEELHIAVEASEVDVEPESTDLDFDRETLNEYLSMSHRS